MGISRRRKGFSNLHGERHILTCKINTIDLDTNDKEFVDAVLRKIYACKDLFKLEISPSLQKGIHIKLFCDINCEKCRIVFDDETRFFYDQFRPERSQNVLWSKKKPLFLRICFFLSLPLTIFLVILLLGVAAE